MVRQALGGTRELYGSRRATAVTCLSWNDLDQRVAYRAIVAWVCISVAAIILFGSTIARGAESAGVDPAVDSAVASDASWVSDGDLAWSSERIALHPEPLVSEHFFGELADGLGGNVCDCSDCETYQWEYLPKESLYPFYLADTKQSRMAGQWLEASNDSTLLDATLGGRFGIIRYVNSTKGPFQRGVQLDFEGSAQVRLDMDNEHDVRSVDFRAGLPLSFSFGRLSTRIGYYHVSSHLGDEFLIKNPLYDRKNYVRDVLLLGAAYWLTESTRIYGEATWAFYADLSEPWEFIFGIEDAPRTATGLKGRPFYAINARLREEVDFGGSLTAQAGWAWRSSHDTGLLRMGLHYFNGMSDQWSFYLDHEQMFGVGLWYDF